MKYIVGIDLGTTSSVVSYAKNEKGAKVKIFPILQLTEKGMEERDLFPSALYLPQGHEIAPEEHMLPWEAPKHYIAGSKALSLGSKIPSRLVLSAKSWLSLSGQSDAILPIAADTSVQKISPIEALKRLIDHIRKSWNYAKSQAPLEEQFVVLTVPASFDEKARRLVLEAMDKGGIKKFTFLEEPQAAFYNLINSHEDLFNLETAVGPSKKVQDFDSESLAMGVDHSLMVKATPIASDYGSKDCAFLPDPTAVSRFKEGDCILVCDIGGGTTDFSLIEVKRGTGLFFERVLVGEHLLIGGDNIDNDLAFRLKERMGETNEWLLLLQEAKKAKEEGKEKEIVFFGSSAALLKSMQRIFVYRKDIEDCIEAFFQFLPWEEAKMPLKRRGMRALASPSIQNQTS